jgi:cation diffusion facilitator family transporter
MKVAKNLAVIIGNNFLRKNFVNFEKGIIFAKQFQNLIVMTETRLQKGERVIWLGFFINIVLTTGKLLAGFFGRSSAMIADGIHSLSDLITDVVVLVFFKISDKEKDEKHPYGHGKFETFSAFIIALILFFVGLWIFYEGMTKIVSVVKGAVLPQPHLITLWAALISIVVKELLYQYTNFIGKQIDSPAIIANAWHHRSDAFSSIGVAIGIAGAIFLGQKWVVLDPIAGVIVSIFIMKMAVELSLPSIQELMEASLPEETIKKIETLIMEDHQIRSYHKLRTRKIGETCAIDVHIQLDHTISLVQAHNISGALCKRIRETFGEKTQVNVHAEPVA